MGDTGSRRTLLEAYARIDHAAHGASSGGGGVRTCSSAPRPRHRMDRRASPRGGCRGALRALDGGRQPRGAGRRAGHRPHARRVAPLAGRAFCRSPTRSRPPATRRAAPPLGVPTSQSTSCRDVSSGGRRRERDDQTLPSQQVGARVLGVEAARHLLQLSCDPTSKPARCERRERAGELGAALRVDDRRTEARQLRAVHHVVTRAGESSSAPTWR